MFILYTAPDCPSCRKAVQFLQDNRIPFIEKNIFSNTLTADEIRYLLMRCENGTTDLLSSYSKLFKSLKMRLEDCSLNELIALIQMNPSLLRRPILLSEKSMLIGFDPDEMAGICHNAARHPRFTVTTALRAPPRQCVVFHSPCDKLGSAGRKRMFSVFHF